MSKSQYVLLSNTSLLWFLINIVAVPVAGVAQYYTFGFLDMTARSYFTGASMFQTGLITAAVGSVISGVVLGFAQSLSLLRTSLSRWLWILNTIVGLLIGNVILATIWLLGAIYPLGEYPTLFAYPFVEEFIFYFILLLLGLVQGSIIGVLQWLVLRHTYQDCRRWIWFTSIGWSVWFTLPLIGLSSFDAFMKAVIPDENVYFYGRFIVASIPYIVITTLEVKRIINRSLRMECATS